MESILQYNYLLINKTMLPPLGTSVLGDEGRGEANLNLSGPLNDYSLFETKMESYNLNMPANRPGILTIFAVPYWHTGIYSICTGIQAYRDSICRCKYIRT